MIGAATLRRLAFAGLACCALSVSCGGAQGEAAVPAAPAGPSILVPLGGNAFITQPGAKATETITDAGLGAWTNSRTVVSVYFRANQAGALHVALVGSLAAGTSTVQATVNGQPFQVRLSGGARSFSAGSITLAQPGYVKVDLQGLNKGGATFGELSALEVSGAAAEGLVCANDAANFYWSRRGPSVHLSYATPKDTEYFYNEVTVPVGGDAIGSYFMANGFGEGYFGIQVNSATERRVLFSVWDPDGGKTTLVRKGAGVVDNSFGGEGTGGQSYLVFNWTAGSTYRFLTRARPDGAGSTVYSAWFFTPEEGVWRFIAAWTRPGTTTYLTGCYSFLENFLDENGYLGRRVSFGNQWTLGRDGVWTEATSATFTGDDTANKRQRLDFAGGLEGGRFYLKNGGFFSDFVPVGQSFQRPPTGRKPDVDVTRLP